MAVSKKKSASPIDLDEPLFTLKQIAQASSGKVNTILSWFQRGHFALGDRDRAAELGTGHAISFRTALEVAIAVDLYRLCDLHPAIGAELAREFTRFGDKNRDPGELFPDNHTVLVVYPGIRAAKVINMTSSTPMAEAFNADQGRQLATVLIWLNFVDRNMRVALLQGGKGSGLRK